MHLERENLDILFRRTAPEMVLDNIRCNGRILKKSQLNADISNYEERAYEHYSSLNLSEYSPDEMELRFQALKNCITKDSNVLLFQTIYEYADKVLVMKNNAPVCRLEVLLGWNSITKRLGQDIFTVVWLARKDIEDCVCHKRKFIWPAVIGTDDVRLDEIFEKRLAENHFHLHGSTQSFAISWACLMNHPEYIEEYFVRRKYFSENLNLGISKGVVDNQMDWKTRIGYAAVIRALLFARCAGIMDSEEVRIRFKRFDRMPLLSKIKQQIESLKRVYGVYFEHGQGIGNKAYLDYAISKYFYYVEPESANRLLAGERSFLYHCFRRQFEAEFTYYESSLLYLYILLKSQFRSELIQVNRRMGFTNFAWYQGRKNQFFGMENKYWIEAQRLSIGSAMEKNHLKTLEARIMPKDTAVQLKQEINGLNAKIRLALEEKDGGNEKKEMPYYVIHFPKKKFSGNEFKNYEYLLHPRNWETRMMAKRRAKALVKYLQDYNQDKYIRGIDACSLEIGCRPEVFATEFRYIRKYGDRRKENCWSVTEKNQREKVGITYHVGEDFLDIIDGLRAIDETIKFIQMQKGDRLGHALALGISPKEYYQKKKREIYLPAQDYLDNLIWILYRSLEFNIQIDVNHRVEMQETARNLLLEIYCDDKNPKNKQAAAMLDLYYESWRLRGDHPDLYRTGQYQELHILADEEYESCMKLVDDSLGIYRVDNLISDLYYRYHFDAEVKRKGLKPACFVVEDWYIDIVREFQAALRLEIAGRGIAIECNPTSNVLIGTFDFYDKHPILTFNSHQLDGTSKEPNIQVSINTDDLGVFDTSLENEYALLLCAICRARHREGNYNDDAVYEYLDYLRENGIRMAF